MKKLKKENLLMLSAQGTGAMCFWSPFRLLLASGTSIGTAAAAGEMIIITYCWNS